MGRIKGDDHRIWNYYNQIIWKLGFREEYQLHFKCNFNILEGKGNWIKDGIIDEEMIFKGMFW